MGPHLLGRRIASLVVLGAVGAILLIPPAFASPGASNSPHLSNPARPTTRTAILGGLRSGLGLHPSIQSPSQTFEESTIDLLNGTVLPGNFVNRADGIGPYALAYGPGSQTIYAADAVSNSISVVSTTSNSSSLMIGVGSDPVSLTYDSANATLWSANYGSGTVSVIDTTTAEVAQTLNLNVAPASLAYDPGTETVFICLYTEGTVLAVNGETYAVEARIPVGVDPVEAYYDPGNGLVYVANFYTNNFSVIDPATYRVTGNFPAGIGPEAITSNNLTGLLYVANWYGNVTEFDPTTSESVGQVDVDYLPSSLAFDSATDQLYVVLCCGNVELMGEPPYPANTVTVVNGTSNEIVTNISVGAYPEAIVDDPDNGLLYVANLGSNNLSVLRAASDSNVRTIPLGRAPTGLAFDPSSGDLLVTDSQSNVVVVLDAATDSLVENLTLGLEVYSAAYDPANRTVAVTDPTGYVRLLNDTSYQESSVYLTSPAFGSSPTAITYCSEANEMVYSDLQSVHAFNASTYNFFEGQYLAGTPAGPDPIACSPTSPDLFVTVGATDQLEVLDLSNLTHLATVMVGTDPSGVVFDPEDGDLYVADSGSDLVTVVSALTDAAVGQIPVGARPDALAFDRFDGDIYVANAGSANLSVIDPAIARTIGSIPTGLGPDFVEVSPINNTLYVANYLSATVSVITPSWSVYPVTFQETGLPSGTGWGVSIGGPERNSSGNSLVIEVPNGTWNYSIAPVPGFTSVRAGNFSVEGAPIGISVVFVRAAYVVSFVPVGLLSGLEWSVTLNGTTIGPVTGEINFSEPNGTYEFIVRAPVGYEASPDSGSLEVNAPGVTQTIALSKVPPISAWANWTTLAVHNAGCPLCAFSATVQFFGNGSGGLPPYSFNWTFQPGGGTSEAQDPEYNFTSSAASAVLLVGDRAGSVSSRELNLTWPSSCPSSPIVPGTVGGPSFAWVILGAATVVAIAIGTLQGRSSRRVLTVLRRSSSARCVATMLPSVKQRGVSPPTHQPEP